MVDAEAERKIKINKKIDQVHLEIILTWCAPDLGISIVAWGTPTHGLVIHRIAVSSTTTRVSYAWAQAQLIHTLSVVWTIVVLVALGGWWLVG